MSVDMGQVENADIATSEDGIRKEETSDAPLSDPRQGLHGLKVGAAFRALELFYVTLALTAPYE